MSRDEDFGGSRPHSSCFSCESKSPLVEIHRTTDGVIRGGLLYTVRTIIFLLIQFDVLDNYVKFDELTETMSRLSSWGFLLYRICSICMLLSLMDTELGILYCWGRLHRARSILQWATYVFALILAVCTIAEFAGFESFNTKYYAYLRDRNGSRSDFDYDGARPFELLGAACSILLAVTYLAELSLSILVVVLSRKESSNRKVCGLCE